MNKKRIKFLFISVIAFFISVIPACRQAGVAFAQTSEEQITITAYYPSPYGVYRELRAQRQAVGETWYSNANVCWGTGCPAGSTVIPTGGSDPDVDLVVEGRVGIGTANPAVELHVHQDDPAQGATILTSNSDSSVNSMAYMGSGNNVWPHPGVELRGDSDLDSLPHIDFVSSADPQNWGVLGSRDDWDARIWYWPSGVLPDTLVIDAEHLLVRTRGANPPGGEANRIYMNENGSVGIGTTSPQEKLHIEDGVLRLGSIGVNEGGQLTLMDADDQGGWEIDNYGSTGSEQLRVGFRDKGANNLLTPGVTILNSGNVGVGTTNPNGRLGVNGEINFVPLTANPTGNEGDLYYNNNDNYFRYYDGSSWQPLGGTAGGATATIVTALPSCNASIAGGIYLLNRTASLGLYYCHQCSGGGCYGSYCWRTISDQPGLCNQYCNCSG